MTFLRMCLGVAEVVTTGVLMLAGRPAAADTFAIFPVVTDQGRSAVGVYGDGSAVVGQGDCPQGNGEPCWLTYDHGTVAAVAGAMPMAPMDNGSACTVTVLGFAETGRCNGSYRAFWFGKDDGLAQWMEPGMYAGAPDDPTLVWGMQFAHLGFVGLNSRGDFLMDDLVAEEIVQGYDTTPAPEPGTLLLLASGAGTGLVGVRRRLAR